VVRGALTWGGGGLLGILRKKEHKKSLFQESKNWEEEGVNVAASKATSYCRGGSRRAFQAEKGMTKDVGSFTINIREE